MSLSLDSHQTLCMSLPLRSPQSHSLLHEFPVACLAASAVEKSRDKDERLHAHTDTAMPLIRRQCSSGMGSSLTLLCFQFDERLECDRMPGHRHVALCACDTNTHVRALRPTCLLGCLPAWLAFALELLHLSTPPHVAAAHESGDGKAAVAEEGSERERDCMYFGKKKGDAVREILRETPPTPPPCLGLRRRRRRRS